MQWLHNVLDRAPETAVFVSIAVGMLIGRLRVGPVRLGGVCGTLIAALAIGQLGVPVSGELKNLCFALFIFALGYSGGPAFFGNLNRQGARFAVLSLIETVTVMGIAVTVSKAAHLDLGTAGGMLAGSATESAVVGTASQAIEGLGLGADRTSLLVGHVATAYTVCYLFGLITIVLFTSQVAPLLLRYRPDAGARPTGTGGGAALPAVVGRCYRVGGAAAGLTVSRAEAPGRGRATVSHVLRDGVWRETAPGTELLRDELAVVVGPRRAVLRVGPALGREEVLPEGVPEPEWSTARIVVTERALDGLALPRLRERLPESGHGVRLASLARGGKELAVAEGTTLRTGDVVELSGSPAQVRTVGGRLGKVVAETGGTDFVLLGFGLAAGVLLGMVKVPLGSVPVSLGTGGGCLVTGLLLGKLRASRPTWGEFPAPAARLAKDLGLAVFIACVGLSVGGDAFDLLARHPVLLPSMGVLMVLVPALLSLWVGRRFLRIEPPVLLGAIAGQQCSTPAISAVTAMTGSATPLVGYTVTYVFSSFLLPLCGPVLIGLLA
ncbi:aspartate-alanine antiporter [Streptomyces sp. NPDC048659]|uniref:aspartate-alanine antiporter-like transporter n=1 Tax=Streptomyces sp. NPDC048659 TaxID=3155489 RepID=UPI00343B9111